MRGRDVVVVGASAGGVEALVALAAGLPANLPAALFVVLHTPPDARSMLPRILERAGPLPARHARGEEPIEHGRIYVAPPNVHLLVEPERVRLFAGPRENGARPAADALFRSAARAHGPRVVGIVLSGALDDGSNGMIAVKAAGGVGIVQDPAEALYPGMPCSALARAAIDHTLPAAAIGRLLGELARAPARNGGTDGVTGRNPTDPHDGVAPAASRATKREGAASGLTCPDCHGALWELHENGQLRYECRVGHSYSVETMLAEQQAEAVDSALWAALNALEERAATLRRLAGAVTGRPGETGSRLLERAAEAEAQVQVLRDALLAALTTQQPGER
jgi:two-component system chemotaxis response regulator CheB